MSETNSERRESVARHEAFLAMSREEKVAHILAKLDARGETVEEFFARLSALPDTTETTP
jgi:hypothetical protein